MLLPNELFTPCAPRGRVGYPELHPAMGHRWRFKPWPIEGDDERLLFRRLFHIPVKNLYIEDSVVHVFRVVFDRNMDEGNYGFRQSDLWCCG